LLEGLEAVTTFGESGLLGSAAGEELDAIDYQLGTPEHTLIIASSEGHSASMQATPEDILMPHQANSGLYDPNLRADVTFFETAAGGAVFAAGSMTWTASLSADTTVARLTHNALLRFLQEDKFEIPHAADPG
jgi:N,N-dimethylformamidase